MKNLLFISDSHFKLYKEERESKRIDSFINHIEENITDLKALFLLGDIFDFWYEWKTVVPAFAFKLFWYLHNVVQKGIEVYYFRGNHDFGVDKYLSQEVGVKVIDDFMNYEYDSKKFFLAHGDGYAASDSSYRVLKRILRSKISNFFFRSFIHPDWAVKIAELTSSGSRKHFPGDKSKLHQEYLSFAKKKFEEGYDYVILGHLHFPMVVEESKGIYANCGDWISEFSSINYTLGKGLFLNKKNISL